jgi:predicted MPP superfamily phosphohydrolase
MRAVGAAILFFVLSLAGAAAAVVLFGAQTFHWRAFEVEASIAPSWQGETRLAFAPLGEIRARTHTTPVAFYASLRGVSFEDLRKLVASPPPRKELEADFLREARSDIQALVIRQVALGAAGALIVPVLFRFRKARYWLLCAAWGGTFVALVFYSGLRSFNPAAFDSPTYTGSLQQADWIITLVKDGFNKAEALSDKLRHVAANLNTLYGRINALPGSSGEPNAIRILHISDIHNNRAAVSFVRELAGRTGVDLVVDTGDLTDFGSPVETDLSRGLRQVPVPYVFVAGNHDSQSTVAAVASNPRAIILRGLPVQVAGLTLLGSPDPSSARPGPGNVDTPLPALKIAADNLLAALNTAHEAGTQADIVCVHDPKQAQSVLSKVPVVLCGHEHRAYIDTVGPTVICNAGTTGAAGARYLDARHGVPLSAAILAFSREPGHRLLYIDQVSLDASFGQYSITRRTFGPATLLPATVSGHNPPVLAKPSTRRAGSAS